MNRVHVGVCPALEDLLLAEEGELSPPAQARVSAHQAQCVTCQSALEGVAGIVSMVGHVTKQVGQSESGSTPDPAEARFQRFLVKLHARRQQRIFEKPTGWPVRRWLTIAALPLLILGFIFIEPHTAVIEADELVRYAANAEATRPDGTSQRVAIKLRPSSHFAMSGVGVREINDELEMLNGIVVSSASVKLQGRAASIAQMLAEHRFHWAQPLSVSDFNAWRSALAHKHDEVIPIRGTSWIALRTTTTDDGDLHEVELTIERDSYRVVGQSFVFETMGTLEIQQIALSVRHVAPAPAPAATEVARIQTRPTRPAPERIPPIGTLPAGPQPDLSRFLDRRLGNSPARADFMPALRRLTGSIRQRLDALQDLSSRYPGSDGPQASPSARARMQRELDLQYQSLREDLDALYKRIFTLTLEPNARSSRAMAPGTREPRAPEDWSRRVDAARAQAFTLDRLTGELRGYDDLPDPVRQRIADTFDALWAAIYAPPPTS